MIKILIFLLSFLYVATTLAMNPTNVFDNPSCVFFNKLRSLQIILTKVSGLEQNQDFSLAEVIILRVNEQKPDYIILHINFAYEYYIQKTISKILDLPEISAFQIKNIKREKAYYEYLRKLIYKKSLHGHFDDFKPTVEELDQHIPSFDNLSILFKEFLDNNARVTKYKLLTLKKWVVFDCCDQVFSSLGTREGRHSQGEDRLALRSIARDALNGEALGTWLCRPSTAYPDNEEKQSYCRTISFNPLNTLESGNAVRIVHIFGIGFFAAENLDNPSTWQHFSSLVELLKRSSQKAFVLSNYLRVEKNLYTQTQPDY